MSIKDLFNNPGTPKIQKSVTSDQMVQNVESSAFVDAKKTEFDQFVPPIDFGNISNFAKFGSAELYYEKSFERIHNYYPYDGTLAEKTEFHNSSSYLDKHVFDNLYPRTNGYMNFNGTSQYITVDGGPHTASSGMEGKTLDSTFDNSMIYNEAKKRTSAFEFRGEDGITVEFWMKVPAINTRTIMHVTGSSAGSIQLRLLSSDKFQIKIGSGSLPTVDVTVLDNAVGTLNVWNHYAVTIQSSSAGMQFKAFKNGQEKQSSLKTASNLNFPTILPTTDGLKMTIAAKSDGTEKIQASLDEFRYWKTARTPEAIFNSWFIPVGGGTNKHDSNVDLGLYFKFNEGITGNDAIDRFALDYSGRINNGVINGYISSMRKTSSAITEKLNEPEFKDPIIYSSHPSVVSKKAEYKTSGSLADLENTSMLYRYFPGWMQEEDEQAGKQLKYLSQVLGSYFDTLWHQINFLSRLHDNHYISGSNKPLPFAKKLLYDKGFVIPDLFVDSTITENLLKKDDNEIYEKQINEVRNTIYHNIYNNLEGIYKSKGTEKSFRNFFRSLGIGQDVVKLKMYADDSTFVLRDNYEFKSFERKYLNFNYEGHFDATLYQTSSANNNLIYLPGDANHSGSFTLETELILPRKTRGNEVGFLPYPTLSSSIGGFHTSQAAKQYTFPTPDRDLSIYVIKEKTDTQLNPDDSHKVRFMVTGAFGEITSSMYNFQYENNKWNLAVRLRHENYPYPNVSGSEAFGYLVEFYGVEADSNVKRNSFYLTSSIPFAYFNQDKIFYAGAHRTNFTGSSLCNTDIKLGFVRYWHSYLSNAAIDQHAYDSETFGANEPYENDLVDTYSIEIPREKTLSFHWAFNDLTGSDSSGELLVSDLSSGSSDSDYGPLSNTIQRYVQGRAAGFNPSAQNALDKTYLQTARKRLPDDLLSSDLTTIKSQETEQFFVDDDVSDNFYSFEKSMYGAISDEMMSLFSTALDLNNLIGQPNQKYHHRYNLADFLRDRFYDDVENEPDIEKFTSFYKWIDDSISIALQQLTPASARFSTKINNIVESHVLERNKYVHQIPILTSFQATEGSIKGITEMKYDWKHGHAPPFPEEEQVNVLWQRERKKKEGLRETLRVGRNNHSVQSSGLTRIDVGGSTRLSDTYAMRRFAKTYDFEIVKQPTIHGGPNFSRQKNIQLFKESIFPAGAVGTSGNPQNIITVGVGPGDGIVRGVRNDDNPPRKRKFNSQALVGRLEGNEYGHDIQGDVILPFNIMSGTILTGYNRQIRDLFAYDVIFSNLHHDVIGRQNEIGMQGPFTEAHIGGLQYRHIDLNKHDTSKTVKVSRLIGGSFASASIQFNTNVLSSKLNEGTGSFVSIRDGDGTLVTALYSKVFDLFDNQFTDMDDLITIIDNKLNIVTNKITNSILHLTQSVSGNFYNYTIQSSSHGFITASGFSGGNPLTFNTFDRNLDGPDNRPEGWGLVFKNHPSQGDNDGSFGFIGVDYGTPYPYAEFQPATRYREEFAKRPINVKNIKTTAGSKAGNFKKEIEIFSVSSEHQKNWAVEAYPDPNINILPPFITTALPNTTNYQTLVGIAPFKKGNIFGGGPSGNRQPDTGSVDFNLTETKAFANLRFNRSANPQSALNGRIRFTRSDYVGNGGVDVDRRIFAEFHTGHTNGNITRTLDELSVDIKIVTNDWDSTINNFINAMNNTVVGNFLSASVVDLAAGTFTVSDIAQLGSAGNGGDVADFGNTPLSSHDTAFAGGSRTVKISDSNINVIQIPRTDLTGSKRNINTRFSAPGGPEVQSIGYLDAYSSTFSAHNALPFRNLSVLGSGSGEEGTIRVVDHLGKRRGLRTLSALHQGKFGIDSQYGAITSTSYPSSGSFNKQHRNTQKVAQDTEFDASIRFPSSDSATKVLLLSSDTAYNNTKFPTTGAKSFSFWINFDELGAGSQGIFHILKDSSNTAYQLTYNQSISRLELNIHDNTGTMSKDEFTWAPDANRWYHVFIRWSGNFANDSQLYIDGTEVSIFNRSGVSSGATTQDVKKITIGDLDASNTGFELKGRLSHFMIYKNNGDNAVTLYNNGTPLTSNLPDSSNIIDFWLLGNETELRQKRLAGLGTKILPTQFSSITGSETSVGVSSHANDLLTIARGVNFKGIQLITGSNFDNMYINSAIPRSDFQYSWIHASTKGVDINHQRIVGYAPRSGIISSSVDGYVEAIVFPSLSTITSE